MKRIVTFVLLLAIALMALVSCNNNNNDNGGKKDTDPALTAFAENLAKADVSGATVQITYTAADGTAVKATTATFDAKTNTVTAYYYQDLSLDKKPGEKSEAVVRNEVKRASDDAVAIQFTGLDLSLDNFVDKKCTIKDNVLTVEVANASAFFGTQMSFDTATVTIEMNNSKQLVAITVEYAPAGGGNVLIEVSYT